MLVTSWVVQVLLIAFFVPSALLKLFGHAHMRLEFRRFGYPYALAYVAGAIELLAGALLVGGIVMPACSAIGALLLVPVMIGATWTNFVKRPAAYGWGTLVILALCAGLFAYRAATAFPVHCLTAAQPLIACLTDETAHDH